MDQLPDTNHLTEDRMGMLKLSSVRKPRTGVQTRWEGFLTDVDTYTGHDFVNQTGGGSQIGRLDTVFEHWEGT
ncbi:hypothetical protein PM082_008552 [Marasmius tenuissimus]|nr:hypothetical protein PM082_008552 [Marasmius tenuissimus]